MEARCGRLLSSSWTRHAPIRCWRVLVWIAVGAIVGLGWSAESRLSRGRSSVASGGIVNWAASVRVVGGVSRRLVEVLSIGVDATRRVVVGVVRIAEGRAINRRSHLGHGRGLLLGCAMSR